MVVEHPWRTEILSLAKTNVRFYKQCGFAVIAEAEVLGVPNWFMSRRAWGAGPFDLRHALRGFSRIVGGVCTRLVDKLPGWPNSAAESRRVVKRETPTHECASITTWSRAD